MSVKSFEAKEVRSQDDEVGRQEADDRRGLLGLLALISLTIPALLIRILLPDLNPLYLAGLGAAVYAAYLVVMITVLWRQDEQGQPALEAAADAAARE